MYTRANIINGRILTRAVDHPALSADGEAIIITSFHLILFALLAIGAGLWWTSSRAKELAVSHARNACAREELQFLDQTVALTKLKPGRNRSGSACLKRYYSFEFTQQGNFRDTGVVTMNGHTLLGVSLPFTRDENGNRVFTH